MSRLELGSSLGRVQRRFRTFEWRESLQEGAPMLLAIGILLLLVWLPDEGCVFCTAAQRWQLSAILIALLALDRLDYRLFGATPPRRGVAVALVLSRLALVEAFTQIGGLALGSWAYLLLPAAAAFYFGAGGAVVAGLGVWAVIVPRLLAAQGVSDNNVQALPQAVDAAGFYTVVLVFATVAFSIVLAERAGRRRAERLLAELERSGRQRQEYAAQALQLTEELAWLARTINDDLIKRLGVALEQLGPAQPALAALRQAKAEAAAALQDVRRSVGALRKAPQVAAPPASDASLAEVEVPRWRRLFFQRPFDLALTGVYLALALSELSWMAYERRIWSWPALLLALFVLALIVLDRLDLWLFAGAAPPKWAAVLLASRAAVMVLIALVTNPYWALWFALLLIYSVFVYFGSRAGFICAALAGAADTFLLVAGAGAEAATLEGVGVVALFWLLILAITASAYETRTEWQGRLRANRLLGELREDLARLSAAADEALAAQRQRSHLAREIHDGLGHYLTAINVQLETALAFREIDPSLSAGAVGEARRMTEAALAEVRAGLGEAPDNGPTPTLAALLQRLVANLAGERLAISTVINGSEDGFARSALVALYRTAQEGLTNVQKHAGPSRVQLELNFGSESASLRLTDDGRGFDPAATGAGGFGLQGLRERLALVGGRLEISSQPGQGTELRAVVPRGATGQG